MIAPQTLYRAEPECLLTLCDVRWRDAEQRLGRELAGGCAMSELRIVLNARWDSTPEQARDARARAWAFVFQCWHAMRGEQHVVTTRKSVDTENETTEHGNGEDLTWRN